MIIKHQSLILTVTLLAVLSLSILLLWQLAPVAHHAGRSFGPAMYMSSMQRYETDENGIKQYDLRARRWFYDAEAELSNLVEPKLVYYNHQQPSWHVSAGLGKIKGNDRIDLQHHVVMRQHDTQTNTQTVINTTRAAVYPQQHLAKTDKPVTMRQNASVIHAKGARFDYQKEKLHLLSQTRGHYVPQTTH